jgi:hypothetical protein
MGNSTEKVPKSKGEKMRIFKLDCKKTVKFKIYAVIFLLINSCVFHKHDKSTEGLVIEKIRRSNGRESNIIIYNHQNRIYRTLVIGSEIQVGDIFKIKYSKLKPNSVEACEKIKNPKIFKNKVYITGEDYPYQIHNLKIVIKSKTNDIIVNNSIKSDFGYLLDLNTIYFISVLKNNKLINHYKLNLTNTKKNDFYPMLIEYSEKKKYVSIVVKENSLKKE